MSYINLIKTNNAFGLYWVGNTFSLLGNALFSVALPWIVYKMTGSAIALSISIILQMLPYILFGLISGAFIDRFDQKKLMVAANLFRTIVFITLLLLYLTESASLYFIYFSIFLLSFLSMIFLICEQGIIQRNVKSDLLTAANSLMSVSKHTIDFLGKIMSGLILTLFTIPITLSIIAVCLLFSVLIISFAKIGGGSSREVTSEKKSITSEIKAGFKVILDNRMLKINILYLFILNIAVAPLSVALPFIAGSTHFEAFGLGLMVAFLSLGSLVGAYVSVPLSKRCKASMMVPLSVILYSTLVPFVSTPINLYVILAIFFFIGLVSDLGIILINTEFQKIVPKQFIGRVSSFRTTSLRVAVPLVLVISSLLFSQIGIFSTMAIFSGFSIILTILVLTAKQKVTDDQKLVS
ncbi:putative transporter [Niallia circulans]|uniref:Major facilitator superfamily (MFS) profile domain-containing protein n=2 Tax=Shouchella clausii TaxID=79880 RepID=A0A268S1C0_SHOCL|nr:MFS transporter [Shouchella clausii]MCM3313593.1 MFS transporter [Psychrobacillus sp. MER TA 17]PAD41278.1 hypothetical protein CHH54_17930 [Bacillus sp. 7520-S]SPT80781.1 putative transporter [Niallia circulans]MBU8598015.1 MFS transporter [Shouchella clausii]MCM3547723.1 MFS transporter [Shouchella clausii]